eukprot:TRINITY_DN30009_c0_g1_i1.p1 TRINITY_DN30009_c0_g1~~TRINITY_DN30009_c0_g1_i1.p1  ORF type:complete len:1381 (-),score=247.10 TRINITY_DN30009_c0_g1_i1:194-4336(-)
MRDNSEDRSFGTALVKNMHHDKVLCRRGGSHMGASHPHPSLPREWTLQQAAPSGFLLRLRAWTPAVLAQARLPRGLSPSVPGLEIGGWQERFVLSEYFAAWWRMMELSITANKEVILEYRWRKFQKEIKRRTMKYVVTGLRLFAFEIAANRELMMIKVVDKRAYKLAAFGFFSWRSIVTGAKAHLGLARKLSQKRRLFWVGVTHLRRWAKIIARSRSWYLQAEKLRKKIRCRDKGFAFMNLVQALQQERLMQYYIGKKNVTHMRAYRHHVFHLWDGVVKKRMALDYVVSSTRKATLTRGMKAWMCYHIVKVKMESQYRAQVKDHLHFKLYKCFNGFVTVLLMQKQFHEARTDGCLLKLDLKRLVKHWRPWAGKHLMLRSVRQAQEFTADVMFKRWRRSWLDPCFHAWCDQIHYDRTGQKESLASKVFMRIWFDMVKDLRGVTKEAEAMEEAYECAADKLILKTCWQALKVFLARRKAVRGRARNLISKRHFDLKLRAFEAIRRLCFVSALAAEHAKVMRRRQDIFNLSAFFQAFRNNFELFANDGYGNNSKATLVQKLDEIRGTLRNYFLAYKNGWLQCKIMHSTAVAMRRMHDTSLLARSFGKLEEAVQMHRLDKERQQMIVQMDGNQKWLVTALGRLREEQLVAELTGVAMKNAAIRSLKTLVFYGMRQITRGKMAKREALMQHISFTMKGVQGTWFAAWRKITEEEILSSRVDKLRQRLQASSSEANLTRMAKVFAAFLDVVQRRSLLGDVGRFAAATKEKLMWYILGFQAFSGNTVRAGYAEHVVTVLQRQRCTRTKKAAYAFLRRTPAAERWRKLTVDNARKFIEKRELGKEKGKTFMAWWRDWFTRGVFAAADDEIARQARVLMAMSDRRNQFNIMAFIYVKWMKLTQMLRNARWLEHYDVVMAKWTKRKGERVAKLEILKAFVNEWNMARFSRWRENYNLKAGEFTVGLTSRVKRVQCFLFWEVATQRAREETFKRKWVVSYMEDVVSSRQLNVTHTLLSKVATLWHITAKREREHRYWAVRDKLFTRADDRKHNGALTRQVFHYWITVSVLGSRMEREKAMKKHCINLVKRKIDVTMRALLYAQAWSGWTRMWAESQSAADARQSVARAAVRVKVQHEAEAQGSRRELLLGSMFDPWDKAESRGRSLDLVTLKVVVARWKGQLDTTVGTVAASHRQRALQELMTKIVFTRWLGLLSSSMRTTARRTQGRRPPQQRASGPLGTYAEESASSIRVPLAELPSLAHLYSFGGRRVSDSAVLAGVTLASPLALPPTPQDTTSAAALPHSLSEGGSGPGALHSGSIRVYRVDSDGQMALFADPASHPAGAPPGQIQPPPQHLTSRREPRNNARLQGMPWQAQSQSYPNWRSPNSDLA